MIRSNLITYSMNTNEYNPFSISITTTEIVQISGTISKKDLKCCKKKTKKINTKDIKIKKTTK